jgi:hypothetical protein
MPPRRETLLQGTRDLLILKALSARSFLHRKIAKLVRCLII